MVVPFLMRLAGKPVGGIVSIGTRSSPTPKGGSCREHDGGPHYVANPTIMKRPAQEQPSSRSATPGS